MPVAARPTPGGLVIPGVELFATGTYRGKRWTLADLDQMAANARRLGPGGLGLLDPPAVLGHEEEQAYLDRTDAPACAWLDTSSVRVRRYFEPRTGKVEGVLVGDLRAVTPAAAHLIRSGAYRKVSAEIYDDFEDDFGRGHGKALRRVALLGGEVPQVKRLRDLPMPVAAMGERRPKRLSPAGMSRTRDGTYLCFAESVSMDRTQMIAALQAAMPGIAQATLDALSDDQLADLVKNLPAPTPAAAAPAPADADLDMMGDPSTMSHDELVAELSAAGQDPAALAAKSDDELRAMLGGAAAPAGDATAMADDPAAMTRDDLIAALVDLGQDPAALDAMTDDDLRALYAQLSAAAPVAAAPAPAAAAPAATPVTPMSDRRRRPAAPAKKFSFAEEARKVRKFSAAAQREYLRLVRDARRAKVDDARKFCERLVGEGRLTPAQVKAMALPALLPLDNTHAVVRFSEGGTTSVLTAYEAKKRELSRLPKVVHYGERLPGGGRADASAEVERVRRFAEVHAPALRAGGLSPEAYVHRFTEARKKLPALTAREYGVPAEFCS